MKRWQTMRAWSAVHATRPAISVMALVALASLWFAPTVMPGFGLIRFATPISVQLVLPAFAGVSAAVACDNAARLPLPDPPRAVVARAAWALGWTTLAALASNVGQLAETAADWKAVTRNVAIHTGLGLLCVSLGYPQLAWLPVLVFTTGSMVFGHTIMGGYYWWAVILEDRVTAAQVAVVGPLFLCIVLLYILMPRRNRHDYSH